MEYNKQFRYTKGQNRYRLLVDQLPNGLKKLHIKGKSIAYVGCNRTETFPA